MRGRCGRILACSLVIGSLLWTSSGCGPERAEVRPVPPAPKPSPTARPRVKRTPRPSPPGAGLRGEDALDLTRTPITRAIGPRTTPDVSEALKLTEQARQELERGTTDNAVMLCERAIGVNPRLVQPYVILARAYLAEGQAQPARAQLDKALALSPEPAWLAEIIALNGSRNEVLGRKDAALAEYRRALGIYPNNQTARTGLARLGGGK